MNIENVFENAVSGDKVWSSDYGTGIVISNGEGFYKTYPMNCKFETGTSATFTLSGRECKNQKYPNLFWKEHEPYPVTKRPVEIDWLKVPVGTPVVVSDIHKRPMKEKRLFALYLPKTKGFHCFNKNNNQETSNCLVKWHFCTLNPSVEIKQEWIKQ